MSPHTDAHCLQATAALPTTLHNKCVSIVVHRQLKPYVSYRVPDVTQSEFTARDLFNATYAKSVVEDFKAGKLDADSIAERTNKIKSGGKTSV
jgi:Mitochondrial ribosomal protein L27